jgi:hypothetical protein
MIIWGGIAGSSPGFALNNGARYNPWLPMWTTISPGTAEFGRYYHTAVWAGTEMIAWGGYNGFSGYLNDGWRYKPDNDTWSRTSTGDNVPGPRHKHTAVWMGTNMIVWGGTDGSNSLNTGGRYNPVSNSWSPTSDDDPHVPAGRWNHTAVWTGTEMIVCGGDDGVDYFNSGGLYCDCETDWYEDADGDGHGNASAVQFACVQPAGYVPNDDDCDDAEESVYPGAPQICDGLNNDCDHPSWPALAGTNEYDYDGDTFTECDGDCDEANALVYPGAPEICDGLNNDCSHPHWPSLIGSWAEHAIATAADGARTVYAADVDGDSDQDVLSASHGDDTIAWYENTAGDGSAWTKHTISTAADGAISVSAADVDGDGDQDALSASNLDDTIAWYENTAGNGSAWTAHTISTAADDARTVSAADVDGDGDQDALSASYLDDTIAWYENAAGDGSAWTKHTISTVADGPISVYVADVDGDEDQDALSASYLDNTIAWFENTAGDGSAWTAHTISTAADGAISVYTADVDGDGDQDALSGSYLGDTIAWYEPDGLESDDDGDSSAECDGDCDDTIASVYPGAPEICDGLHNDCDHPNWPALPSDESDDDGDMFMECNGECDDGSNVTFPGAAENESSTECRKDADEDGYGDSAPLPGVQPGGDCDDAEESVHPGAPQICDGLNNDCDHPNWPALAGTNEADDLDSDGFTECAGDCDDAIASVCPGAPEVCDGLNNDCSHPHWPSLIGSWVEHTISTAAYDARTVYAADVNGDSDQDVLSASHADDTIAWHENTAGDGSAWTGHTISTAADGAISVFAADVDGDGDQDALSASNLDDTIAWYENTAGDGSAWTAHTISTAAAGTRSVSAADVDGDGDQDALSASYLGDTIAWYENTAGNGSAWTEHTISTVADGAISVYAADVDGDGDQDALSASYLDNTIAWYENTAGNGSAWAARTISTAVDGAISVYAADVDGDGDQDALSASYLGDTIAWYENTAGDGSAWTVHTISMAADGARSVYVADVDGDGDRDALSASSSIDRIAWYENTAGDGSAWTEHTISTAADGAQSVFAADVNGDGKQDALSASYGDDTIAWYEPDGLESDEDGDSSAECDGDCDDTSNAFWWTPSEAWGLTVLANSRTLRWQAPAAPGSVSLVYDTIRSANPTDFDTAGTCIESDDGTDTAATMDVGSPPVGNVYCYLVRAENGCGGGSLGNRSDDTARSARDCP